MNIIVTSGPCQHQRLAYMNTTGGAMCIDCPAVFSADSPEGKRAEAAYVEWSRTKNQEAVESSGNVFRDLGFSEDEAQALLKASDAKIAQDVDGGSDKPSVAAVPSKP